MATDDPDDPETCRVAKRMLGGYAEIAYDILPHLFPDTEMRFEPFYRWEINDTQNEMPSGVAKYGYEDFQTHVVGLQFYPHPQVVIKANYRNVSAQGAVEAMHTVHRRFQAGEEAHVSGSRRRRRRSTNPTSCHSTRRGC